MEENYLVFVHRWSLITRSFMQIMSHWKIKSVVAINRELLNKGGLEHIFDGAYMYIGGQRRLW